jgi:hypothetical protein
MLFFLQNQITIYLMNYRLMEIKYFKFNNYQKLMYESYGDFIQK